MQAALSLCAYVITTVLNEYGGFPNDGCAVYEVSFSEDEKDKFDNWETMPLSGDAKEFMHFLTSGLEWSPNVQDGYWKFIKGAHASEGRLCIYDKAFNKAYWVMADR